MRPSLLHDLHVSTVFAGCVSLIAWIAFRDAPAAVVAGALWLGGALAALLSRQRGARRGVYVLALAVAAALLLRSGIAALGGAQALPSALTIDEDQKPPSPSD